MTVRLLQGDAQTVLTTLSTASVHAVICDPPYPEISRKYGRMSEAEWHDLMRSVVMETRRILTPTGSAVFVLQANQEYVGRTRPWLWEFMAWTARDWNMVQDVWWWNFTAPPTVHCNASRGLMRPSVKACVWLGGADCYRDQDAVLWSQSDANAAQDRGDRALINHPSGSHVRPGRIAASADRRGGVTPFNLIPIANADSANSSGAHGHGAGTPMALATWWVKYITRPGETVCDPFCGAGTIPLACDRLGRHAIGIDKDPVMVASERIMRDAPLFAQITA